MPLTLRPLPGWQCLSEEFAQIGIGRGHQLRAGPLEADPAVMEHHEVRARRLCAGQWQNGHASLRPHGLVRGHVERIANLVSHDDGGDLFQVSKLDDFIVDRRGNNRDRGLWSGRRTAAGLVSRQSPLR